MQRGVVYMVDIRGVVAKYVPPDSHIVGVVVMGGRVRIWARGGGPEKKKKKKDTPEEEMYWLAAYHRAKDFLDGSITTATFSGSWEIDASDVKEVLGTIGAPGTARELPAGIHHPDVVAVMDHWLMKPAIVWSRDGGGGSVNAAEEEM